MNYSEKLKDPRWQKKRLEILQRDEFSCQGCYAVDKTLHIHHRIYIPGRDPWEYDETLLITLCESCHLDEKEKLNDAINALVVAIKEKFLAGDIQEIADGFKKYKTTHADDVCACSIHYFLSNCSRVMVDEYFKYLRENREAEVEEEGMELPF